MGHSPVRPDCWTCRNRQQVWVTLVTSPKVMLVHPNFEDTPLRRDVRRLSRPQVLSASGRSQDQPQGAGTPALRPWEPLESAGEGPYQRRMGRSWAPRCTPAAGVCRVPRVHLHHIEVWHCLGPWRKPNSMQNPSSALGQNSCFMGQTKIVASSRCSGFWVCIATESTVQTEWEMQYAMAYCGHTWINFFNKRSVNLLSLNSDTVT